MKNMFYIVDQADESKFPIIGTENFDLNGAALMSPEDFEMFGHNVMQLLKLRCPNRDLALVWESIPETVTGISGIKEEDFAP